MKNFLAIGNALMDVCVQLNDDAALAAMGLKRGDMTLIDSVQAAAIESQLAGNYSRVCAGGSAANTALAMAMMRDDVFFAGCIGRDRMGRLYKQQHLQAGVTSVAVSTDSAGTGVAYAFISPDGERTFATHLGAAAHIRLEDVHPQTFGRFGTLYVEGYLLQDHDLMLGIMQEAEKAGVDVCLDLSSTHLVLAERDFMRHILTEYVDIVFANREEALAYAFGGGDTCGVDDPVHTAATMLGRTCRTAVVKLGADGAMCIHEGREYSCPAVPVARVVDTTGAGDFFAGGFMSRYMDGADPMLCLESGAQCASRVIQVVGTRL